MSQEIRDFFMEEAEELFDNLHSILLKNEEAGDISAEEIDSLFRDMHTLKGGAGSVEMMKFSGYTHHLETFMDLVKNGEVTLNSTVIDFLIESVGTMQEILQDEYDDTLDESEYTENLQQLIRSIEQIKAGKAPVETTSQQVEQKESKKREKSQIFGENAAEMIDLFEELEHKIEAVREGELEPREAVDAIFRTVHTIKGASQFLNLKYFPTYLHEVESLLDNARNGEIPYTLAFNAFMENVVEHAQELIDQELNSTVNHENFHDELDTLKEEIAQLLFTIEDEKKAGAEESSADEPQAFELFEENSTEEKQEDAPLAFELFDEESAAAKEPAKEEVLAFELFDEAASQPQTETPPKADNKPVAKETPAQAVKKPTSASAAKKPAKKRDLSLNKAAASTSIRVNLDKIDQLMNRVGDLVITKSMLFQFTESIDDEHIYKAIYEKLSELDRDIRELQESVMSVRMVPMESVYSRLPKMVRDLAKKLDKKIKFEHIGDSVEIDKMMVEGLMDPLTHIIRNSLDHGVEKPEVRYKKGKPETGKLIISAEQESGNIIISIRDDGAGIDVDRVVAKALENGAITEDELMRMSDQDKLMLVFHPGLSTAEKVTDVSGRGVGMDVVMNNITSLGGHIRVYSKKDKGTEFQIILPLTLAILDGLNVLIGDKKFILPLNAIVESLQPQQHMIKHVGKDNKEILMLRREFIPIIRLYDFFNLKPTYENLEEGMLIIVKTASSKVALFVDDFLNQEQIVVKSLEKNYKKIKGIGAATIRGDGSIGLILDVTSIVEMQKGAH
jgi:two-component system chemotaxis sensor kinase CheA